MIESSYAHGSSSYPLLGETISHCLNRITETYPENDALISCHQHMKFSYRQFNNLVHRAARSFISLGIEKGDRVAIWSTNNYEWVVSQYATAKIGAILININPSFQAKELEYVLKASRCKALILIESYKHTKHLDMLYEVCPELADSKPGSLQSWRFPDLSDVILIGKDDHPGIFTTQEFSELGDDISDNLVIEREASLNFDDPINIQYTSGTTGFPKGVVLTHHNILNNAYSVGQLLELGTNDKICVPVPFYHCFGMVVSNLAAITHGACIVIPSPSFEADKVLSSIETEKCTVLHGVPTMFVSELSQADINKYDLTTLRTGIMAGAPCPIELMNKVREKLHLKDITIAYGMTEFSPVATMTSLDTPVEKRVSTVGKVIPHVELKIIDTQTNKIVPPGTQGEICFRGYAVMKEYDNNPEATNEAIDENGWLYSGDIGTMDEEGYVMITGRKKDMVIRGGENLYPREIEEFLFGLDIINDVQVVGIPDEKYGEELLACVKLESGAKQPTTSEFREMCKGQISHFKIPKYWMIVEEFPMTVTGKIQKFKIREMVANDSSLILPD